MAVSRSPFEFLQRNGIVNEVAQPGPRLEPGALLVNFVPVPSPPNPNPPLLRPYEGEPVPDRSGARPWPTVTE